MIVKNEGATLGDSLASTLPFVDEYVIGVDDKTADNTLDEAWRFVRDNNVNADVHFFTWEKDFSKARNDVIERATGDFIFTLDGHERVMSGHEKIKDVARDPGGFEVFAIELHMRTGNWRTAFFQERMFLRKYRYFNACHNVLVFDEAVGARLGGVVLEHDRSDELTEQRQIQRHDMNIPPLLERIRNGDRRAKAQLPQEYMSLREWGMAIAAMLSYLKEDMQDAERYQVLIKLAMCYYWNGDPHKAEMTLLHASRYNADNRNAHFIFLAELYAGQGRGADAENLLRMALEYPRPEYFWFLYPQFYHEYPRKLLRRLNDNNEFKSHRQAAH